MSLSEKSVFGEPWQERSITVSDANGPWGQRRPSCTEGTAIAAMQVWTLEMKAAAQVTQRRRWGLHRRFS